MSTDEWLAREAKKAGIETDPNDTRSLREKETLEIYFAELRREKEKLKNR